MKTPTEWLSPEQLDYFDANLHKVPESADTLKVLEVLAVMARTAHLLLAECKWARTMLRPSGVAYTPAELCVLSDAPRSTKLREYDMARAAVDAALSPTQPQEPRRDAE